MIKHLASLADERLVISFAPKTLAYSILKRIGELFPGPSKVMPFLVSERIFYLLCVTAPAGFVVKQTCDSILTVRDTQHYQNWYDVKCTVKLPKDALASRRVSSMHHCFQEIKNCRGLLNLT